MPFDLIHEGAAKHKHLLDARPVERLQRIVDHRRIDQRHQTLFWVLQNKIHTKIEIHNIRHFAIITYRIQVLRDGHEALAEIVGDQHCLQDLLFANLGHFVVVLNTRNNCLKLGNIQGLPNDNVERSVSAVRRVCVVEKNKNTK